MKVLISEKLSEHKYKTPEGYLICTDAILARTGKQSYTKDELFQDGDDTEVNVDRPYDEVMNAKTIASFENKPITFDHPDEDVNVGNYKDYAIGYVRDVRQGKTDKGEDVILGNLVITDQDAINAIEQGDHTDLSCGYDCDIRDDGNGNYSQTNIRGNHLALCEQGRAGIARIVDSKVEDKLSYNSASSDDNYLDEVEKMIYKFANVRVDAMLVGDKLKIAAKNSKGFNSKQLNDIASVLMKNVAVSNITISNPDKFDSNVTAKIVDSKVEDKMNYSEEMKAVRNALRHIVVDNKSEMKQLIQDLIDNKPMNYSLEVRRLKRAIDELIKWSDNRQEGIDTIWAIAKENRIVDSKVEDIGWKTTKMASGIIHELGNMRIIEEENEKGDIQYRIGGTNGQVFSSLEKAKNAIRRKHLDEIEDSKLNYDTLKEIKSDIYYAMKGYWQTVFSDEWFDENAFSLEQDYHDERLLILRFKIRKEAYFRTETDFEKFKARLTTIHNLKLKKIHKKSVKVRYYDNAKFTQVDEITFQYIGQMTDSMIDDYSIKEIEDSMNDAKVSKEMTMSDAIKMLDIVDAYKKAKTFAKDSYIVVRNKSKYEDAARKLGLTIEKDSKSLRIYGDKYKLKQLKNQFDNDEEISYVVIKDASKDKWVIKNTGLAYEIWNQGKMVKKFPTKKLAIEWIHSRFPTDEITEDSTKDGRLWQTLTRKAKH